MLTEQRIEFLNKAVERAYKPETKFAWVYRGEGEKDPKLQRGARELSGTWFTEYFDKAVGFKELATENGAQKAHIVAVAIPKFLLEKRNAEDKGMGQINIWVDNNIEPKEIMREILIEPTADDYLDQFVGYDEYKSEKKEDPEITVR